MGTSLLHPLDPHGLLVNVHPDLVKVIEATARIPQSFIVVYGLRTLSDEERAVATGHSTTLHSRHLADPNYGGKCCAVDIAALDQFGHISWQTTRYPPIAAQVKAAAAKLNIPVEWGGDWASFQDWGHFQLPWKGYP